MAPITTTTEVARSPHGVVARWWVLATWHDVIGDRHMSAGQLSRQFRLAYGRVAVQLPDDAADRTRAMTKDTHAGILLATTDLNATFERLQASDTDIVQQPTEQPHGVRDCAVRDLAGNLIRIQQFR